MRLAIFDFRQAVDYRLEILSGLTVAMALIPEAVAFALIDKAESIIEVNHFEDPTYKVVRDVR
ncbi:MAG TPA: hypothetical protein DCL98_02955 [Flavobacteriales bacterium]|nr:hypothetical protein [Flavobacteriales bacterium]